VTTNSITQPKFAQYYIELVNAIVNLSEAYLYATRLDDALQLLSSDIVELLEREFPPEEIVRIRVQRAKIMRFKNKLDNSSNDATLELLFGAERTAQSLDNKSLLADVTNLIGLVVYDKELWTTTLATSLRYFEQALAIRRETNDQKGIVESLFNIGTVHQNKKGRTDEDIERAFKYFQEAYRLAKDGGFRWEKAHAARHLGYIYGHHKRDLRKALSYHKEFLDVNEEVGFKLYLPPAHTMVGFTYYELEDLDRALEHFKVAQTIAKETGDQQPLAEAWLGLGLVQEGKGDTGAALKYFERALAIAHPINLGPVIRVAASRIDGLAKGK
jgi:tetratricopeptide (TPR) repeat protein